jgi:hypothetical protein
LRSGRKRHDILRQRAGFARRLEGHRLVSACVVRTRTSDAGISPCNRRRLSAAAQANLPRIPRIPHSALRTELPDLNFPDFLSTGLLAPPKSRTFDLKFRKFNPKSRKFGPKPRNFGAKLRTVGANLRKFDLKSRTFGAKRRSVVRSPRPFDTVVRTSHARITGIGAELFGFFSSRAPVRRWLHTCPVRDAANELVGMLIFTAVRPLRLFAACCPLPAVCC